MAVSIEGAAPPLPNRQWSNAATISSSRSTPGYTCEGADAVQAQHRQPVGRQGAEVAPGALDPQQVHVGPVTGSVAVPWAEVFPPA